MPLSGGLSRLVSRTMISGTPMEMPTERAERGGGRKKERKHKRKWKRRKANGREDEVEGGRKVGGGRWSGREGGGVEMRWRRRRWKKRWYQAPGGRPGGC